MRKLQEMKYSDIFKDPDTLSGVDRRNAETRTRLLSNDSLRQIVQRSKALINELVAAEAPYIPELENLAVEMVKNMYPIIDEYNIEIEVSLGEGKLPPAEDEDEEEVELKLRPKDQPLKNDEVAKRRLINAITQGASIFGSLDRPFMDFLDDVDDNLLQRYSAVVANLDDSVTKYGETLKKVFGIYYDKEAVAMLLAMLAGGDMELEGGESEADFDDDGNLKIRAAGLIFPFLIHEIVKGLYEIISLQGFTKDASTNMDTAAAADKLEHEPEDFGTGTHILADLKALYNKANVPNKISFELFLVNVYREDDAAAFIAFIENLLNNKLTSSQKQWAERYMEPPSGDDDDDEDGGSGIDLNVPRPVPAPAMSMAEGNKKPYKDLKVTKDYIIREFNKNVDPIELKWHRDREDRIVEIVGKTDWKIQLEDQLPTSMNESIFIPKGEWHRLIKGNNKLVLKIHKK